MYPDGHHDVDGMCDAEQRSTAASPCRQYLEEQKEGLAVAHEVRQGLDVVRAGGVELEREVVELEVEALQGGDDGLARPTPLLMDLDDWRGGNRGRGLVSSMWRGRIVRVHLRGHVERMH